MLTFWKKLAFLSLSVVSAMLYHMVYMVIPQFSSTINTLDNNLPLLTQAFFSIRPSYLWLFASTLVLSASWIFAFIVQPRYLLIKQITVYNFMIAIAVLILMLVAMYLPTLSKGYMG